MAEMSLSAFVAHLVRATAELAHAEHEALTRAARIVEAEAKREIGEYQDEAGPFAPWAELADSTKADRVAHGFPENEPLLRTGELRESIGHAVGDREAVVGSDSDIAVYQELGTSQMPPRSFLGGAAFRKSEEVARALGSSAVQALVGKQVAGGSLSIK